jgi:chromosome segregation ATPase
MPNHTLASNAASMPTRRAALASIAAAGAMLAVPAAAALTAHPDAELLALQSDIDIADREFEAVLNNLTRATARFYELRDELRSSEAPISPAGKPISSEDPEWKQAISDFGKRVAELRERFPTREEVAHDEARERREQAEAEARVESGLADAERAELEKSDVVSELKDRVLAVQATTLAGLIFKAKYAAAHYTPGDYDSDVMISIVDDLLAMSGEA